MSRCGRISMSLMNFQMTRVISSPSSSTTRPLTLILPSWDMSSRLPARGLACRSRERLVESLAGPHDCRRLLAVRVVVAADVDGLALRLGQLGHDGILVVAQRVGQRGEVLAQVVVIGFRKLLRPVQRQVELAAAVVEFAGLARRALVVLQQLADRGVQRLAQNFGALVVGLDADVFETRSESKEFTQGVPAQVVL